MQLRADIDKHNSTHCKKSTERYVIALEESDFIWTVDQVRDFRTLWREGKSLMDIAEHFKRTHEEVTILIMDQALKDFIEPRERGIYECHHTN